MKLPSMRLAGLALGAGLLALLVGATAARAGDPDEKAVVSALTEAVAAAQQSFTSPVALAASADLKVGDNATAAAALKSGPSLAEVARVDSAGKMLLGQHFAGTALTDRLRAHSAMIVEQENRTVPGFTPLGGGVSDVQVSSISVDGDTASVHAIITTWARMSQVERDGHVVVSQPSNDLVVDASLLRSPDGWKVTEYEWTFAPGSEP